MTNCLEYQNLSPKERWELIGKLVHCVQCDSTFLEKAQKLIYQAERKGLFHGVTILPNNNPLSKIEEDNCIH